MSLYDSVFVDCPCGGQVEFQSKGGPCIMDSFEWDRVPIAVAGDISNGHCDKGFDSVVAPAPC